MARRRLTPVNLFGPAVGLMLLLAFLPMRWTSWVGWFRGPAMTIIAPISTPLAALSSWLRPGEGRRGVDDADASQLRAQLEFYKAEYLRAEQQVEQLRLVIEALQEGVAYGPAVRVRRLEASRVGADLGSGTITVARGSVHGVSVNSVAVAIQAPQHLVGPVTDVGPTVSTIHTITDRRLSPNLVETLLVPSGTLSPEALAIAPRCQFRPVGDGSLAGELGAEDAARIKPGDSAFLDDPSWPSSAQRLIVGRVVRSEDTERPLFKRVVIRPDFDPMRVRGVVLRIPSTDPAPAAEAPASTPEAPR
ncbi:MAG: rod shape-determining protein MreC [Planctomycetota bacterium]|nr:rod shape-determining protein MreC [Planctomycetota bacterium]